MYSLNTRQDMELNDQKLFEIREDIKANRLKASMIRQAKVNK